MARPEIVPFADEHLDGAAALLAERHVRHRAVESLLPGDVDFREQIERDGTGGGVALDGDEVISYLLGTRREDRVGPHVWSHIAGHAVRDPELARNLYAAVAGRWVDARLTRHLVYVPALPELVDPWFRLSFGASAVLATRETAPAPPVGTGLVIRETTPEDTAAAARLERLMSESMLSSPSFSGHEPEAESAIAEEWADTWEQPHTYRHFVTERDGRIVGHVLLYRRPPDLRAPPTRSTSRRRPPCPASAAPASASRSRITFCAGPTSTAIRRWSPTGG